MILGYHIGWIFARYLVFFFFFQAEDGIRDYKVTGVQTCALPICALGHRSILADPGHPDMRDRINAMVKMREAFRPFAPAVSLEEVDRWFEVAPEIGRASCRERV